MQCFSPGWGGGYRHGYPGTWECAECVSEWKVLYVRLSSSRPWQKNFLSTSPPSPQALHYAGSHFFLLPPLSLFLVPPLSLSSSTSTGLSKWSQRNALWSNNPGGWHHRDKSERGGERTRETREVEKRGGRDSCEEGGRTGEIKMHEDKLESNRAPNIISKVRLSLNIRS